MFDIANATRWTATDGTDPVAIARSLRPLLADHAARSEAEGRIVDDVLAALRANRLFDVLAPHRANGMSAPLIVHIETVAELAKGCVGTAWAYGVLAMMTAGAKSMPPHTAALVFRTGDELCCVSAAPTGTAERTADGYVINGTWGYCSGVLHADAAMIGVGVREREKVAGFGSCLIDLHDPAVEILDDWHVAGVVGSGSRSIRVDNMTVPNAAFLDPSLRPPTEVLLTIAGLEPCDLRPTEPLFALGVLGPMLGAAAAMLEAVTESMGRRPVMWWNTPTQRDSDHLVALLGHAALRIDTAWLHVRRAAALVDDNAPIRALSGFELATIQADCGHAMEQLRSAGSVLMDIAGPAAFADANPLQRYWRDLNLGSRHNVLNAELSAELLGRALLGLPSNSALLSNISR